MSRQAESVSVSQQDFQQLRSGLFAADVKDAGVKRTSLRRKMDGKIDLSPEWDKFAAKRRTQTGAQHSGFV